MKPNLIEERRLQLYLSENLKYSETYAEFYDHISAALETKPADAPFEDTIGKIIADDFGGIEGMRLIEDNYQHSIFTEMRKKYLHYAVDNLKLPVIGILFVIAGIFYYIAKQPWFTFIEFILSLFCVRALPALLQMVLRINTNSTHNAPRRSIKWGFMRWQNFLPAIVICAWLVLTPGFFNNSARLQDTNPIIMTVLFALMMFHSLTFYRVCRSDIKAIFRMS